jgi:hypothetical protein
MLVESSPSFRTWPFSHTLIAGRRSLFAMAKKVDSPSQTQTARSA